MALEECGLFDLGYFGRWYTWKRGNLPSSNIQKRLDHGIANAEWLVCFLNTVVWHMAHSYSDYCPLLILPSFNVECSRVSSFKFEAWWTLEPSFEQEVRWLWSSFVGFVLAKLDCLRVVLIN